VPNGNTYALFVVPVSKTFVITNGAAESKINSSLGSNSYAEAGGYCAVKLVRLLKNGSLSTFTFVIGLAADKRTFSV